MKSNGFDRVILDLRKAGFTDALIARLCNCSRQYIGKIRRGNVSNVSHSIGARLEKLHGAIQ